MARLTCNECGSEASAGAERCPRCGAPLPVLFDGGAADGGGAAADGDATVVTAAVSRGPAEPGDLIAGRFQPLGEPRADLWGSFVRARDTVQPGEITLYRLERGVFRTRDDIERFRAAQQDLIGLPEPVLALPTEILDAGGQYYLVYRERLVGTLRDAEPAAPFRGTDPEHVRRMLRFAADFVATAARLGPRGLHLGLRPSVVFVLGRELKVAQLGFCSSFPPELVRRRHAHDNEGRFYTAPEVQRQGRGSPRADLYSLALIIGYAVSSRERSPQLKDFEPHPAFADLFRRLAAGDETQRPGDLAALAGALAELIALPAVIAAPRRGPAPVAEHTAEVDVGELEEVDAAALSDATGEVAVEEIQALGEASESGDEVVVSDVVPVLEAEPLTDVTGEISAGEVQALEVTAAAVAPSAADDSWSSPPRPTAPAARRDLGPAAVQPADSDGSIDPRLLRAAVRSDAQKGIGARAKAVDLLRRDAAKGDARAKELLMDASARMPARPSVAPAAPIAPPPAGAPAAAPASMRQTLLGVPATLPPSAPVPAPRPSAPAGPARTAFGMPSPMAPQAMAPPPMAPPPMAPQAMAPPPMAPQAMAPPPMAPQAMAPQAMPAPAVPPGYGPPPGGSGYPPAYGPPPGGSGYPPGGSAYPPGYGPPPAVALPMSVPSTQTMPTSQVPVLPGPPVTAPTVPVVPPAAAAAVSRAPAAAQGWPPGFQASAPSRAAPAAVQPRPAPSRAAPRVTAPAPLEIPSSVVGPDLVVKGGAAAKKPVVTMEPDDAELQTGRAQTTPQGPMPVMVRKVPRPLEDDQDLPPTEAWSPMRDEEPPKAPRRGATVPSAPLFDDSYKQTDSQIIDQQQLPMPPDRSMDLIWWSLAIAGALVLVALLITFK